MTIKIIIIFSIVPDMQGHSTLLDATFASAGASYKYVHVVQLSTQLAGPRLVGQA